MWRRRELATGAPVSSIGTMSSVLSAARLLLLFLLSVPVLHGLELGTHAVTDLRPAAELRDIPWQRNPAALDWADPDASRGGSLQLYLPEFPRHLRRFGPDTDSRLRPLLESLHLPLLARHPTDQHWLPMLAEAWWFDTDQQRLFFALSEQARWSDNTPVTTTDVRFSLEFLQAPGSQADWQRQRLQALVAALEVYDERHFAFRLKHPINADHVAELADFRPLAAHAYRGADWPADFNWNPEPVTGPYQIEEIHHNEGLVLVRDKDWWGQELPYFRHRFNVSRITLRLLTGPTTPFMALSRAELDLLPLNALQQQHASVQALWQQHRLTLRQWYPAASAADSLLLLHPDSDADAREWLQQLPQPLRPPLPLLVNDQAIRTQLAADIPDSALQVHSASSLLHRLQEGRYALVWLRFAAPLPEAALPQWLAQHGIRTQPELYRLLPLRSARYALHWSWLKLPALPHGWPANPFEAFDAVTGGLFWIDRKQRADILANPLRSGHDTPHMIMTGHDPATAGHAIH